MPYVAGLTQEVVANAAALASGLASTGHAVVHGILFDTGKAEIKPASAPALEEVAKLLKQDSMLRPYVVGHTDNVGGLAANVDLSRRRAAAVVQLLSTQYGVTANRLQPYGDGPYAPLASNDTEDGRAVNRRVELGQAINRGAEETRPCLRSSLPFARRASCVRRKWAGQPAKYFGTRAESIVQSRTRPLHGPITVSLHDYLKPVLGSLEVRHFEAPARIDAISAPSQTSAPVFGLGAHSREDQKRFSLCRALADHLVSGKPSLVTRSTTEHQQRNRAFAADFLPRGNDSEAAWRISNRRRGPGGTRARISSLKFCDPPPDPEPPPGIVERVTPRSRSSPQHRRRRFPHHQLRIHLVMHRPRAGALLRRQHLFDHPAGRQRAHQLGGLADGG